MYVKYIEEHGCLLINNKLLQQPKVVFSKFWFLFYLVWFTFFRSSYNSLYILFLGTKNMSKKKEKKDLSWMLRRQRDISKPASWLSQKSVSNKSGEFNWLHSKWVSENDSQSMAGHIVIIYQDDPTSSFSTAPVDSRLNFDQCRDQRLYNDNFLAIFTPPKQLSKDL